MPRPETANRPTVSLVLGAGGARGYAHIGAIEVLQDRGYEVIAVTGSSMGALVGGMLAAGVLQSYAEWVLSLRQRDVLRLMDPSISGAGVMRAERLLDRVRELIDDQRIEELPVPFTAVAIDLLAGREIWLQRGPLDIAIRASIAMPGVFTPVTLNGRLLADGGLLDPLPVAPAAAFPADLTVAISLIGERDTSPAADQTAEPGLLDEWVSHFRRDPGHQPAVEVPEKTPTGRPGTLTGLDVLNYAFDAVQAAISRYRLAAFPPDVLITIPKDACRTMDFHRAAEMVELGREVTAHALDAYEAGRPATPGAV